MTSQNKSFSDKNEFKTEVKELDMCHEKKSE